MIKIKLNKVWSIYQIVFKIFVPRIRDCVNKLENLIHKLSMLVIQNLFVARIPLVSPLPEHIIKVSNVLHVIKIFEFVRFLTCLH